MSGHCYQYLGPNVNATTVEIAWRNLLIFRSLVDESDSHIYVHIRMRCVELGSHATARPHYWGISPVKLITPIHLIRRRRARATICWTEPLGRLPPVIRLVWNIWSTRTPPISVRTWFVVPVHVISRIPAGHFHFCLWHTVIRGRRGWGKIWVRRRVWGKIWRLWRVVWWRRRRDVRRIWRSCRVLRDE